MKGARLIAAHAINENSRNEKRFEGLVFVTAREPVGQGGCTSQMLYELSASGLHHTPR